MASGGAKVLAKAEQPAPAQQGGTAWQQLIAQLDNDAAQPGNRIEITKYYAFGGARVAMRQAGSEVFYLAGDHLGSASVVLDWQGRKISEMRYTPWGETRWAWELDGVGYTNRLYTSQLRQTAGYVGQLYDYGARFYNPTTARFVSADSFVQSSNDPLALNRYAFTRNNPIRYNDPSGHFWQEALKWLGETFLGAVVGGLVGVAGEATNQVIDASQHGKSLSVATQEFSLPENTSRLIGAGIGGAVNGGILAGSRGKGGVLSFAAGGIAGGQAEALTHGLIDEKQAAGDHFDLSKGVERAAQYGFLDFGTVVKDAATAVIAGKVVEFAGGVIDRYIGGQIPKIVKQIDGFDPVTKQVIIKVVSKSPPKPLTPLQRAAVVATKRVVDWISETFIRSSQSK